MNLTEALEQVAVIGAAGKMGSGISFLLLKEVALLELQQTGNLGQGSYHITLVDNNRSALSALKTYLRKHLTLFAERQINQLRRFFSNNLQLVSNHDIVFFFVERALDLVSFALEVEEAQHATIVFEAVIEDLSIKTALFRRLTKSSHQPLYFFTNTSSIPIHVLNESANLKNRIIGFHFYNPPAVQKLVELIPLENGEPLLYAWACELAKNMGKQIVLSKDIAGFVGNGFFLREALFACAKARELASFYPMHQALYMVNKVTQEFLVRPMGIFQLLDFVGIDICSRIGTVMNTYLSHGSYDDSLIEKMMQMDIRGGQHPDGSQKNGFLCYENHEITGVYSLEENRYILFNEGDWKADADALLGTLPTPIPSWKLLHKKTNQKDSLKSYFESLSSEKTLGANLACEFLYRDKEISRCLVDDGVAFSIEDVKTVMKNGFYHLYGPGDYL